MSPGLTDVRETAAPWASGSPESSVTQGNTIPPPTGLNRYARPGLCLIDRRTGRDDPWHPGILPRRNPWVPHTQVALAFDPGFPDRRHQGMLHPPADRRPVGADSRAPEKSWPIVMAQGFDTLVAECSRARFLRHRDRGCMAPPGRRNEPNDRRAEIPKRTQRPPRRNDETNPTTAPPK